MQALGKLLVAVAAPPVLLGLVGHFSVACLYSLFFHGQRSVYLRRKGEGRGVSDLVVAWREGFNPHMICFVKKTWDLFC